MVYYTYTVPSPSVVDPDPRHFGNMDPQSASNKNPDPDQIKICDKLEPEPDPHQFPDNKPKCMEYEPI